MVFNKFTKLNMQFFGIGIRNGGAQIINIPILRYD